MCAIDYAAPRENTGHQDQEVQSGRDLSNQVIRFRLTIIRPSHWARADDEHERPVMFSLVLFDSSPSASRPPPPAPFKFAARRH